MTKSCFPRPTGGVPATGGRLVLSAIMYYHNGYDLLCGSGHGKESKPNIGERKMNMKKAKRFQKLAILFVFVVFVLSFATLVSAADRGGVKLITCEQTKAKVVKLSWEKMSGTRGYQVQYRTGNGSWRSIKVNGDSIDVTGLKEGKTYQFRVRAILAKTRSSSYSRFSSTEEVEIVDETLLVEMKGFTIKEGKTDIYEDPSLKNKTASISDTDEFTVKEITSKYAEIAYSDSGKTKKGYIKTSDILTKMNGKKCTAGKNTELYTRPNGKKIDSISKGTKLIQYGEKNGFVQVRYKSSKGFKLGFVKKQDI
jgi:hypothetical protein